LPHSPPSGKPPSGASSARRLHSAGTEQLRCIGPPRAALRRDSFRWFVAANPAPVAKYGSHELAEQARLFLQNAWGKTRQSGLASGIEGGAVCTNGQLKMQRVFEERPDLLMIEQDATTNSKCENGNEEELQHIPRAFVERACLTLNAGDRHRRCLSIAR
jgi:hypothetical protein